MSLAPNPEYQAGRGFASTDHLAADAVVAYVDGVLGKSAVTRAEAHMRVCDQCASEVAAQAAARAMLRSCSCDGVAVPKDLLGQLNKIPTTEIDVSDMQARRHENGRDENDGGR